MPPRDNPTVLSRRRLIAVSGVLGGALLAVVVVAIAGGAASFGVPETARYLWAGTTGGHIAAADATSYQVIWQIRTPRVLLAALVGAGLGAAGAIIQAASRNVLADPYLLGVSSGASVGAVAVSVTGVLSGLGIYAMSAGAFAGALLAAAIVYFAVATGPGGLTPVRLVLTGVVIAAGFQAVMSVIVYLTPDTESTATVLFWSMGSFGAAAWGSLPVVAVGVGVVVGMGLRWARVLDVMTLGDESAAILGCDAAAVRRRAFVVVCLGAAAMTATSGAIGFAGLVVPHAARMLVGVSHRVVMVVAPLSGAILMVVVDLAARVVVAPRELPLTALTALIGVPIFLWLIRRRGEVLGAR